MKSRNSFDYIKKLDLLQGQYKDASRLYSKALRYLDTDIFEEEERFSPSEADSERLLGLTLPLKLNRLSL